MLFNRDGKVWMGRRIGKWDAEVQDALSLWQMPQGGIDEGEEPCVAAVRELAEETGVRSVRIIGEHPQWLQYDLPAEVVGVALKGKYRGQRQKWFAMQFGGDDSEINITPSSGEAEFDKWRWEDPARVSELVVPFKRNVYKQVMQEFLSLIPQR
jgi:putative (di)nucleoside polyphosphate hydrolase